MSKIIGKSQEAKSRKRCINFKESNEHGQLKRHWLSPGVVACDNMIDLDDECNSLATQFERNERLKKGLRDLKEEWLAQHLFSTNPEDRPRIRR